VAPNGDMETSAVTVGVITATFVAAGMVKGITGMGLPTVAMGVLGAVLSPLSAAALLLVPSFVTNVWQLFSGPRVAGLLRRLWSMMAAIVIGTLAGSVLLAKGDATHTTMGLGVALVGYAAFALLGLPLRVPPGWERWTSPIVGLITGVVTGSTGVFVIPAVPYIQSLGMERDELVQALGLSFTVSTVALAAGLLWHGAAPAGELFASTAAVIPALIGMAVGQAIRTRISPLLFRRVFLVLLLALGAEMSLHALL
jgi:uncharacterized protein